MAIIKPIELKKQLDVLIESYKLFSKLDTDSSNEIEYRLFSIEDNITLNIRRNRYEMELNIKNNFFIDFKFNEDNTILTTCTLKKPVDKEISDFVLNKFSQKMIEKNYNFYYTPTASQISCYGYSYNSIRLNVLFENNENVISECLSLIEIVNFFNDNLYDKLYNYIISRKKV